MSNDLPAQPRFIALDWGTSSLRAWLMSQADTIVAQKSTDQGIMQIRDGDFAAVYRELIGDWIARYGLLPVLASGMIGSRDGWTEAEYVDCPADPDRLARSLRCINAEPVALQVVPGLIQHSSGSRLADVMRGEETQVLGALRLVPELASQGLLVLPGTHSKWVRIAQGQVNDFATYMTGELFDLLKSHSILGQPAARQGSHDAPQAFIDGVETARRAEARGLSAVLFSARSRMLAGELASGATLDYLSGLLIGSELRSALLDDTGQTPLYLIGQDSLCRRYQQALARFDRPCQGVVADAASTGLWHIAEAAGFV